MTLEQALTAIAEQLNLDAAELIGYAHEDYFTGWDNGTGQFPVGSLFGMEGQILYALVRATGATQVLELGTHVGASTAHIALAMHKRGVGRITTVDVQQGAGGMIPSDLLEHVTFVNTDAVAYLATVESKSAHIIFEDLWHSSESCEAVGRAAKRVLAPGGLLISHDAEHPIVGADVRAGYDAAGIEYKTYLVPPSDCGLLIASPVREAVYVPREEAPPVVKSVPAKQKAKRTRGKVAAR